MTLNSVNNAFLDALDAVVPKDVLRPVETRYTEEPRGMFKGQGAILALPRTVEDVAALIRTANAFRVPVVPYGGGTGLVGGQVMPGDTAPMILSLERMSAIRGVYPQENVVVAEAGAILSDVQSAALSEDRLFPLSLASEGSCRIGGNLSTNAGGLNVLRYGTARDLCLGLEAVLPSGNIWHGLTRLRKDNTGYDLRNLLVGAEGTLGVITAAALRVFPVPARVGTAMISVPSPKAAIEVLARARSQVGEAISAFELIHGTGLHFLSEVLPHVRQPMKNQSDWYVLVELGLSASLDPEAELSELFAACVEGGLALDGVIAQSESQRADLWQLREQIPEANRLIGSISSHDISLPIGVIPEFIETGALAIAGVDPSLRINSFGHLGDGNLHYNVFPPKGQSRAEYGHLKEQVKNRVYELVQENGGSISAEHGIGRLKTKDLVKYGDPVRLEAMRAVKHALDPVGIMNPGAVLG
ncbi:MAG: FAD-binding oxidoreductase [Paracoccaceae bacterium]